METKCPSKKKKTSVPEGDLVVLQERADSEALELLAGLRRVSLEGETISDLATASRIVAAIQRRAAHMSVEIAALVGRQVEEFSRELRRRVPVGRAKLGRHQSKRPRCRAA